MSTTCPTCHMLVVLVLVLSAGDGLFDVHDVVVDIVCDFGDKRQGCWSKSPSNIRAENDPVHPHLDEFWIFRPWSLLLVFLVSLSQEYRPSTSRPAHTLSAPTVRSLTFASSISSGCVLRTRQPASWILLPSMSRSLYAAQTGHQSKSASWRTKFRRLRGANSGP